MPDGQVTSPQTRVLPPSMLVDRDTKIQIIAERLDPDLYDLFVSFRATVHEAFVVCMYMRPEVTCLEATRTWLRWRTQPQTGRYEQKRRDGLSLLYWSIQTNTVGPLFRVDPFEVALYARQQSPLEPLLPHLS